MTNKTRLPQMCLFQPLRFLPALILALMGSSALADSIPTESHDTQPSAELKLHGGVKENLIPTRPLPAGVIETSDFIGNKVLETGIENSKSTLGGMTDSHTGSEKIDKSQPFSTSINSFFKEARATASPISDSASGAGVAVSPEAVEPAADPQLKKIIVRVTGFNEDAEITPKINLDAFSMANKLLETKKRKCVIMLERTGVKLATTGYVDMAVNGNLIDFRKLIKAFIASGGEVVVNKKWCDDLSVQSKDILGGVQMLSESEVASLILDSDKIVDYATANYPFNMKFYFGQPNTPSLSRF